MSRSSLAGLLALVVVLAPLAGCRNAPSDMADVSGAVTFNGDPIEDGMITFVAAQDGRSSAAPIKNGKYATQCFPGPKKLEITAHRLVPGKKDALGMSLVEQYVPANYNRKSELSRDVKWDSANVFDIDVKTSGK